jgi:hypothetical protein
VLPNPSVAGEAGMKHGKARLARALRFKSLGNSIGAMVYGIAHRGNRRPFRPDRYKVN